MLGRTYEGQNCSVAKSLELIGERWTMLDRARGLPRPPPLRRDGRRGSASPATCSPRASAGSSTRACSSKVRYQERPERFEYRLTEKGIDLWPVMVSLIQFGDRYYAPDGPPMVLRHKECGGAVDAHRICDALRRAPDRPRRHGAARARRSARRRLSSKITVARRRLGHEADDADQPLAPRARRAASSAQRQTASSRSSQRDR